MSLQKRVGSSWTTVGWDIGGTGPKVGPLNFKDLREPRASFEEAFSGLDWITDLSGVELDLSLSNGGVGNFREIFKGCTNLEVGPTWDFSGITSANGFNALQFFEEAFSGCTSLRSLLLPGIRGMGDSFEAWPNIDLSGAQFDGAAFDALFSSLGTAVAGGRNGDIRQTINIASNPGTFSCNPSIAGAKGWNVIGNR